MLENIYIFMHKPMKKYDPIQANKIFNLYIKQAVLTQLNESDAIDMKCPGNASLTYELAKPANKGLSIGPNELEKIKQAVKHSNPSIHTFEFSNNQLEFDKTGSPNNFHIVIRKVRNSPHPNQFKYVMWYVPFVEREDIDKPGEVHRKETTPFDNKITKSDLLKLIYNFFEDALLMNQ